MRLRSALTAFVLAIAPAAAEPVPDSFYLHPGKLIAVDGSRRLNLSCM